MKKVLLHICCGPCAIVPIESLRSEGLEVSGFFYNPNIQPSKEFVERFSAVKKLATSQNLKLVGKVKYEPEAHLWATAFKEDKRCPICYALRLERTAEIAKEEGFEAFTSTLMVSPHQKFDQILDVGRSIAEKVEIDFLERDFRPKYSEAVKKSKALDLYRQQYCGCIYSEKERYARDTARELR